MNANILFSASSHHYAIICKLILPPSNLLLPFGMKTVFSFLILSSMMLHCASRLGMLEHLYQQRHQIAFRLGWISDIPVPLCNSDYHFKNELGISQHSSDKMPLHFNTASEIILYLQAREVYVKDLVPATLSAQQAQVFINNYSAPSLPVYRPPCNS